MALTQVHPGCCHPPNMTTTQLLHGGALPSVCSSSTNNPPASKHVVEEVLNVSYSYNPWLPQLLRTPGANSVQSVPDIYPLPGSHEATSGEYFATDAGFSVSALVSLATIGLVVRVLVYLSLVFTDRTRRR